MRTPSALPSATAASSWRSISGSRTSMLQHARQFEHRGLATNPEPTTSRAPVPFQRLVKEALSPAASSSTLLSPAPKRYSEAEQLHAQPADPPTWSSNAETSQTKRDVAEASGSKLYDNRALMIIRLIRSNRILSAMTAFVDDVADPARKRFTSAQLESIIVAMRIQSKKHSTTRPAPQRSKSIAGDLWRPPQLDPSIPAKSLPIPIQCIYAMATVYDVSVEHDFRPTARMTSAMLSTFVGHLTSDQVSEAAENALGNLVPSTARDQGDHLRKINHPLLATFINIYGRIGKPELGEQLLMRWTNTQVVNGVLDKLSMPNADDSVDVSGWGNNVVIWNALIKARVDADDLQGARKWLDRYRQAAHPSQKDSNASSARPPITPEPYLAYMAGIRRIVETPKLPRARIRRASADIGEIVRLMFADQVPISNPVLAFVVGFEARVGNINSGSTLMEQLSGTIQANVANDAHLLRAMFHFHTSAAGKKKPARPATESAAAAVPGAAIGLPSTRSLIRSLVELGEGDKALSTENLAACRSRNMLNDALLTVMTEADYPAAIVVLNLFEKWSITPSELTYTHVLNALLAQGHHPVLFSDDAPKAFSESRLNLESTLHRMARQGNDEQAQIIRRAIGDSPAAGEIFVGSAQPASPLRQTQYLTRVLNLACAAEIESTDPSRTMLSWLTVRRNADREDQLSHDKAMIRVMVLIQAAQTELLGPKGERNDHQLGNRSLPSSKAKLFKTTPSLSPRRRGSKQLSTQVKQSCEHVDTSNPVEPASIGNATVPSERKQAFTQTIPRRLAAAARSAPSARAFSTSALASNEGGVSCDLSSTTKEDFSHLDPVRAIYIPGFVPYDLGLALQEHLVKQRSDARAALRALSDTTSSSASTISGHSIISPRASQSALEAQATQDTLLLLQHRPVYTEGRRHDSEDTAVSTALRSLGADYHLTKRGGQITYHGPGQLVGYPILNLSTMNLASRCYVDKIQDSLISLLGERGVETVDPPDSHTGVWADEYHKIASIGIQVRHRISSHGFALNVEKRAMGGFRHIVACGIVGRNMTCLWDRLDPQGPFARYNPPTEGVDRNESVQSVAESYKTHFANVFRRRVRDVTDDEFSFDLVNEHGRIRLSQRLNVPVAEDELVVKRVLVDGQAVSIE